MLNRPKIGLLTGAYFEYWKMYPGLDKKVENDMRQLCEKLEKKLNVVWSGLADTIEKTDEAGRKFKKEDIDLLVICEGTYFPDYMPLRTIDYVPHVPVLILLTQPQDIIPLDMDYPEAIRNSFGLVGLVQLTGAFSKTGKNFEIVIGALNDDTVCDKVADYATVALTAKRLRFLNIGIIGHTFQGMYDLELDKTRLKQEIGPSVIYIEVGELISEWEKVSDTETNSLVSTLMKRYNIEGPDRKDITNAARLALGMQGLVDKYQLHGLCHLCQHLIHVETKTTPCLGSAHLVQGGCMTTCEGDIGNLVCMCILNMLTGSSPYFGEWAMYDVKENAVLIFHHGAGNPELARSSKEVSITPTGEKWGFEGAGASYRFVGKPGEVTIASLICDKDGWRFLISGGQSITVPCRPFYGEQFMVKVDKPVKEYLESLCRLGVTHHAILVYGNVRDRIEKLARILKVKTVTV